MNDDPVSETDGDTVTEGWRPMRGDQTGWYKPWISELFSQERWKDLRVRAATFDFNIIITTTTTMMIIIAGILL